MGLETKSSSRPESRLTIPQRIQFLENIDGFLENTFPPLRLCLRLIEGRKGGHNHHSIVPTHLHQVISAHQPLELSDLNGASVLVVNRGESFDNIHQIGIHLRGATGDVNNPKREPLS